LDTGAIACVATDLDVDDALVTKVVHKKVLGGTFCN
jgi:hypothetical protein